MNLMHMKPRSVTSLGAQALANHAQDREVGLPVFVFGYNWLVQSILVHSLLANLTKLLSSRCEGLKPLILGTCRVLEHADPSLGIYFAESHSAPSPQGAILRLAACVLSVFVHVVHAC